MVLNIIEGILILWLIFAIIMKNKIYYEDLRYWLGFPAIIDILILTIACTNGSLHSYLGLATCLCAAIYPFLVVLILRKKRMGSGVRIIPRLVNIAEVLIASATGILACTAIWYLLLLASKLLELLFLPFGLIFHGLINFCVWVFSTFLEIYPIKKENQDVTKSKFDDIADKYKDEPTYNPQSDSTYPLAETLAHVLVIVLVLALICIICYLIYTIVKNSRMTTAITGPDYDETESEGFSFRKGKKKSRARIGNNNDKIRKIYREYLFFMQLNGVKIADETTSEDVLKACSETFDSPESAKLRALYIRARYTDDNFLTSDDVKQAKELWKTIQEDYKNSELMK
jgi:hypothetical protein